MATLKIHILAFKSHVVHLPGLAWCYMQDFSIHTDYKAADLYRNWDRNWVGNRDTMITNAFLKIFLKAVNSV